MPKQKKTLGQRIRESRLFKNLFNPDPSYSGQYPSFLKRWRKESPANSLYKLKYELYSEMMQIDHDRKQAYLDYEAMDIDVVASALDLWADDATQFDPDTGRTISIDCIDPYIKDLLEELFFQTLNIEEHIWDIVRTTAKYGDFFVRVVSNPEGGIGYLDYSIYPGRVQRIDNRGRIKQFIVDESLSMNPWDFVHFKLPGSTVFTDADKYTYGATTLKELNDEDQVNTYGQSAIAKSRKVWKQLQLEDDSVVLSRLSRAVKRNIFQVDVSGLTDPQAFDLVESTAELLKKQKIVYQGNGMQTNTGLLNPEEDVVLPVGGGKGQLTISELGGDVDIQHLADVDYLNNKLFASLKTPKSYLGFEEGLNGRNTLRMMDVRYARTIKNLQRVLVIGLERVARIHLSLLGIDPFSVDFDIRMPYISTIEETEKAEALGLKMDTVSKILDTFSGLDESGQFLNKEALLRYVLKEISFPEDEINKVLQQPKTPPTNLEF